MPVTQANRLLELFTPLPHDQLLIKRLSADEGMSRLFQFELEILHEENQKGYDPFTADPKKLIGQPMLVTARQEQNNVERHFHGICVRFSHGGRNPRWSKYQATLVPKVWLLTQRVNSRIFQQRSVPDILRDVLAEFEVSYECRGTYYPRDYCVQYRESDWDFISRLMEEEGIFYYFEHTSNSHKLVISDDNSTHKNNPSKHELPYSLNRSSIEEGWTGSIYSWKKEERTMTGRYTTWDTNFELYAKNFNNNRDSRFDLGPNKKLEHYDYPNFSAKNFAGITPTGGESASDLDRGFDNATRITRIRQEEIDAAYETFLGTGDCCAIVPGYKITVKEHPTLNGTFITTSLRTEAVQSPPYTSDHPLPNPYSNSIAAISYGMEKSGPFRPARRTPRPIIHGTQTAVVVGPSGEKIFTDKYGRVKVQFPWDREGKMDHSSSCWLRVAQTWAGNGWGSMFIPRIGMEVLVDFLEGDPDQPIIVGCLYNPANMPPYTLPDEKSKSTIKTNSVNGGGFNEIRFEDKDGSEQIFVHAQKDADLRVKNDSKEIVGHDRHLIVENEQLELVKADKHLQVKGNHNEKIGGTMSLNIGSNLQEKVSNNYALQSGMGVHIKAGMTAVIEAGTQLTLKVGGNFIDINPAGVSIKGTMVLINSGGAAGSGTGCNPGSPKDPKEADKAEVGKVTKAPSAPQPPTPASLGTFANLMTGAAQSGTPFCNICNS